MKRSLLALISLSLIAMAILAGLVYEPGEIPPTQAQVSWLQTEQIVVSGTGTGGAVSAENDTDGPVQGHLYAVYLDFASSISTTTDITITQASPALTVLQLSNYYTDTWYYPAAEYTDSAGSGLSAYAPLPVLDTLTVEVGQTISSSAIVTATVYWGE